MYIKTGFFLIRQIDCNNPFIKKIRSIPNHTENQFGQWKLILFGIKNESFFVEKKGQFTDIEVGTVLNKSVEGSSTSFDPYTGQNILLRIYKNNKNINIYRDPLGINGIYYGKNGTFFTNSIHLALSIHDKIEVNTRKLVEYLSFRYVAGSETIYSDILQVLPGHFLDISKEGMLIKKYCKLEYLPEREPYSFWRKKTIANLKKNIDIVTRRHDTSLVGLLLSRGVDSNILLGILDNPEMLALTGDFIEEGYEEALDSRLSNEKTRKNAHTRMISFDDYYSEIPKVIAEYGMPLNMPNMVSYSLLYKDAYEKGIRYLISGEGADALFGGISFYKPAKLFAFPLALRRSIGRGIQIIPEWLNQLLFYGKKDKLIGLLNKGLRDALISSHTYADLNKVRKIATDYENPFISRDHIFDSVLKKGSNIYNIINEYHISVVMAEDPRFMLTLARAKNIELWFPFLQKNMLDLILKMPIKFKFKRNITKFILKDICTDYLPHRFVYNRKSGFGVPLEKWMYNRYWYDDIVENVFNVNHYEFDRKEMASLKEDFILKKIKDYEYEGLIWTLYNYCIWKKQMKGLQSL